jgi:hypothetical protein
MSNFNSNSRHSNVRNDRFGNPTQLIGCKDKKGNGFAAGFIEIGGSLYKIEPSQAQKDGVLYWVKVTKMAKRQQQRGF